VETRADAFLLGDLHGNLHVLEAQSEGTRIVRLTLHDIGHISSPRALVLLDHSHCFVGSHYGDSQLLKVSLSTRVKADREETPMEVDEDEAASSQPHRHDDSVLSLEVVSTFTNLAPIVDFVVVENEHQSHVVTCSGSYNDGSLRIVSHGVGMAELASLDLDHVQRVWAVASGSQGRYVPPTIAIAV
jgi:DNA damage-binding protein 1